MLSKLYSFFLPILYDPIFFYRTKNPTTSFSFLSIFFYNDPTRSVSPILFYTALFYQTKNPTTTGFSFLSIFLYTKPNSFIFFSPSKYYYKKIVDNSHHVKRDRGIIIHCVLRISIILPLPLLADEMDGGAMKSGQVVQPLRQNRIGWLVGVAFTTGPVYC